MTVLDMDGNVPERTTEYSGYSLPPFPDRPQVSYDGYGRYRLPSPSTGRPTAYTRATTISETLDETFNLNQWKIREAVRHVIEAAQADDPLVLKLIEMFDNDEQGRKINGLIDEINNRYGGRDAAELGTAVHAWLEAIDMNLVLIKDVPDWVRPYVDAYFEILRRTCLTPVAIYVERVVLNDEGEQTITGTLDRIYLAADGTLVLGDVKTSRSLEFGWIGRAGQLYIYGRASKMLFKNPETGKVEWHPMPKINQSYGVIMHIPSDDPTGATYVTVDLEFGSQVVAESLTARRLRKEAPKLAPGRHTLPIPTAAQQRETAARLAIQTSTQPGDLSSIWEEYQDVWTDDLTQLGETVIELHASAPANALLEENAS